MIRERYAIWNNKGGVGKSTLCFHIAATYAECHPEEKILVVDMCPQANCTMTFLGSGTAGEKNLIALENKSPAPTIAGYITYRIAKQSGSAAPTTTWATPVKSFNRHMPGNLFLVAGDGNLELIASTISYYANAPLPPNAWAAVHSWVSELIEEITKGNDTWTVFIDTNPSFGIYTELAMIAAKKLLVPFNADDSSRHAVSALARLLYGAGAAHPVYDKFTFRNQTTAHGLSAPKCHLFLGNRFTQYKGSATAFSALSKAISDELYRVYSTTPAVFSPRSKAPASKNAFLKAYTFDVRDFNTAGVVAAHHGMLLSKLTDGRYSVHGQQVEVRRNRLEGCVEAIQEIVAQL